MMVILGHISHIRYIQGNDEPDEAGWYDSRSDPAHTQVNSLWTAMTVTSSLPVVGSSFSLFTIIL